MDSEQYIYIIGLSVSNLGKCIIYKLYIVKGTPMRKALNFNAHSWMHNIFILFQDYSVHNVEYILMNSICTHRAYSD